MIIFQSVVHVLLYLMIDLICIWRSWNSPSTEV